MQKPAGYDAAQGHSLPLDLIVARRFGARARGLLFRPALRPHQGLCLYPCSAIHTVGLRYSIDVLFLDVALALCRRVDALPPHRMAMCPRARYCIELPAGYCRQHPDYLQRIRQALSHSGAAVQPPP